MRNMREKSFPAGATGIEAPSPVAVIEASRGEWDAYLSRSPEATGCHLWGWREVIERTFRHRTFYLLARRGAETCGALPLVLMKSLLFGRFLSSLPYLNYGGFLASDPETEAALLQGAVEILRDARAKSIELRHVGKRSC